MQAMVATVSKDWWMKDILVVVAGEAPVAKLASQESSSSITPPPVFGVGESVEDF